MGIFSKFRRKKKPEVPPQNLPPPELILAIESLPPHVKLRLENARSSEDLQKLQETYPETIPILEELIAWRFGRKETEVIKTLEMLLNAASWEEAMCIIEDHPELLSEKADNVLAGMIETHDNPQARLIMMRHRQLLARCRKVGIKAAFEME